MHGISVGVFILIRRMLAVLVFFSVIALVFPALAGVTYNYTGELFDPSSCLPSSAESCAVGRVTGSITFAISPSFTGILSGESGITAYNFSAPTGVNITSSASSALPGDTFDIVDGLILSWFFGAINSDESFIVTQKGADISETSPSIPPISVGRSTESGVWRPVIAARPAKSAAQSAFYHDSSENLAIAGIGTAILAAVCPPCFALEELAISLDVAALAFSRGDPPDFDYTDIASPTPPPVPVLPSDSVCLTSTSTPLFNGILQDNSTLIGLIGAANTSFNRATGAYLDGAVFNEALQLNAANGFIMSEKAYVSDLSRNLAALSSSLPTACDPTITASDVRAFQAQLATDGFSASELSELDGLGVGASDIPDLINFLTSIDPNAVAGTYPAKFLEISSSLDSGIPTVPEPSSIQILMTAFVLLLSLRYLSLRARIAFWTPIMTPVVAIQASSQAK